MPTLELIAVILAGWTAVSLALGGCIAARRAAVTRGRTGAVSVPARRRAAVTGHRRAA